MSLDIIEKELMAWYGAAVLECNKVEHYLNEILKQKGLIKSEDKIITLGTKIGLFTKCANSQDLVDKLEDLNRDRKLLVHGLSVQSQNNELYIVIAMKDKGKKIHREEKLNQFNLKIIVQKAQHVSSLLVNLMDPKHIVI